MKPIFYFTMPMLLCLFVGWLSSLVQTEALIEWYPGLVKSPLTPPEWVFTMVWVFLYMLMALSVSIVLMSKSAERRSSLILFATQLLFSYVWSAVFFAFHQTWGGFYVLLILDLFVMYYILVTYTIEKVAAYLMIPYAVWLLFASYLNGFIAFNN